MKRILFIIIVLVASATLQAQVREFQISAQSNSIIRTVDDAHVLIYTQSSIDSGFFIYYKKGDNTALAFRVPTKWEIHDVRIHKGVEAYFCGTTGNGLIGMFNIASVFSGTGSVNYTVCGWTEREYVLPIDLKRLDLFEYGGHVHMAMTGSSLWFNPTMLPNTTVMSAYLNGGNWHYCCYCNKERYVAFTDVACLEDVIVAVGTNPSGNKCYLKAFSLFQNFPNYGIDVNHVVSLDYPNHMGDVLAVHKKGNFAILSQFNSELSGIGTLLYDVELSPTTGVPTTTSLGVRRSTPPASTPYGTSWRMKELNWDGENAWLLQDAEYMPFTTGITDCLLRVPMSTPPSMAALWQPIRCDAQSMDMTPSHFPWLSGKHGNLIVYEPQWNYYADTCYDFDKFNINIGSAIWNTMYNDDGTDNQTYPNSSIPNSVFPVNVILICE